MASVLVFLAGCAAVKQGGNADLESVPGLEARLRGVGSAASGMVKVVDRGDGVTLTLNLTNLLPGRYRLAFHDKATCSSPNLFSAGPAWAPPSAQKSANELIPGFAAGSDGDVVFTTHLRGVRADGNDDLRGRTVVLHAGDTIDAAVPDQRNNRVACGVFDS
ncbi:MAG: superoxide dismutase family protein, partial [Casimicrobiaceae bacterium]